MTNIELVNSKLTAIADEIRELSGAENPLSLDTMAVNVQQSNEEILAQQCLIEQAVAALEGKVSPNLYEQGYEAGHADGEAVGNTLADSIVERTITEFVNHRITKIGQYAFARHAALVRVDIPNVERVETYGFNYCTGLTEIYLPKCKYIAGQSFNSCSKLEKVVVPMCEQIGGHALTASKLSCLVLGGDKVCTLDNAAAIETNPMKNGTGFIYVPDNLVDSYKAATNWSTYASQIRPLSEWEGTV